MAPRLIRNLGSFDASVPDWDGILPAIEKRIANDLWKSIESGASPESKAIELRACASRITFIWFLRLTFDDSVRHPKGLDNRLIGLYRPHGMFWQEVAYATRQLHSTNGPYANADRWWKAIWDEWHLGATEAPSGHLRRGKVEVMKRPKAAIQALQDVTGSKSISYPGSPIFEEFLAAGYQQAARNHSFNRRFWNPFVKSFRTLIKTLDGKDFGVLMTHGEKIALKIGPKNSKPYPMG